MDERIARLKDLPLRERARQLANPTGAIGLPSRTYAEDELRSLLTRAAFSRVEIEPYSERVTQPDGRTIERVFHLVHVTASTD